MYISRVEIDMKNRKNLKELTHVGAFHGWVENSFPTEIAENVRSRKLWRIDSLNGKTYLLLVSKEKPDVALLEKYGVSHTGTVKAYDPFLHSLESGQKLAFRVKLNPVVRLSAGKGNKGVVKPHVTMEHQLRYFFERAEKNGFSVDENAVSIVDRGYDIFYKSGQKRVRLVKAVYEGVLEIKDITKFQKTLMEGMGKHKAYGFGLMTVIPVRR